MVNEKRPGSETKETNSHLIVPAELAPKTESMMAATCSLVKTAEGFSQEKVN